MCTDCAAKEDLIQHVPFHYVCSTPKSVPVCRTEHHIVRSCSSSTIQEPKSSQDTREPFSCSICLDLVYKPIVQACGHIFCFWCAIRAMNIRRESHCPVCRRPYMYFPRVCRLMHFMLMKTVLEQYERRALETKSVEESYQIFSPRIEESARHQWSPRDYEEDARLKAEKMISSSTPRADVWPVNKIAQDPTNCNEENSGDKVMLEQEEGDGGQWDITYMQRTLKADDVLCGICEKLVYRPVVLNCGEVFCESCLKHDSSTFRQCPACKSSHPGGPVLVCLELHQFLQSVFPDEYGKKEHDVAPEKKLEDIPLADLNFEEPDATPQGNLHKGVGCDGCGMFPIVGDRYVCEDCTEKIGFDLCGSCYDKGGTAFGRFSQAHNSTHRMVCVASKTTTPVHMSLNMGEGTILRRRQQNHQRQQQSNDLDDYIESFIG